MQWSTLFKYIFIGTTVISASFVTIAKDVALPVENFSVASAVTSVQLSPNGKLLAMVRATTKLGDYIVEIRPTDKLDAKPVLLGAERMEITGFTWLNNEKISINFRQNIQDGNRNYWVSKIAIVNASGEGSWRVPFPRENASNFGVISTLPTDREHILLTKDIDGNFIPDVVKYNIYNGSTRTIFRGNQEVSGGFIADFDGEIRAAQGIEDGGESFNLLARVKGEEEWLLVKNISPENREDFNFLSFSVEDPDEVYVSANNGKDTTSIYLYNIKTQTYSEPLFSLQGLDVGGVLLSGKEDNRGELIGFSYVDAKPERYYIDEYEKSLFDGVQNLFKGKFVRLVSRAEDDNQIIIYTEAYNDPGSYYLLSNKKDLTFLAASHPLLPAENLSKVRYLSYKARDGKDIPAYVTIPQGKPPFPTIVVPHGGPWVRDTIAGFDEWAQLLANNGYLVIQPQYRGSTGYGLEHWIAGDAQWGLSMQDDKDDGVQWLVERGLADPNRLAMFGWSYGGYAAFAASMREDNIYKCAIAGAGVSDLNRISATLNSSRYLRILQRPTIRGVSPLQLVEKVNIPILVVHGDIDQRVPVEHSREFVKGLEEHAKHHKYIELEGADHFSNTLYYRHKIEFYTGLLDWLDNTCFPQQTAATN